MPDYDKAGCKETLDSLLDLGSNVPNSKGWFGYKRETTPIGHLIGVAVGFGGLPQKHAYYRNVDPKLPVGEYTFTAKDVPVRAFWSVSLHDKEGHFQKNPENAYNFNSVNAKKTPTVPSLSTSAGVATVVSTVCPSWRAGITACECAKQGTRYLSTVCRRLGVPPETDSELTSEPCRARH